MPNKKILPGIGTTVIGVAAKIEFNKGDQITLIEDAGWWRLRGPVVPAGGWWYGLQRLVAFNPRKGVASRDSICAMDSSSD